MNPCMRILALLMPVALSAVMADAHAAVDPADLAVAGTVRTPACTLSATAAGVYQYGDMSQSLLPVTGHVALAPQTQTWTVDCGAARTFLMYSISDNRASSASVVGESNFGLGSMPGVDDSKIGYYTVGMSNAKVDGVAKSVLYVDGSGTRADASPIVIYFKSRRGYSWHTATGAGGPWADFRSQAGSRFDVDLQVSPQLASRSVVGGGHPIVDKVDMDGSATVTFSFGL